MRLDYRGLQREKYQKGEGIFTGVILRLIILNKASSFVIVILTHSFKKTFMNTKIKLAENFVKSVFELLDEQIKGEPTEKSLADRLIEDAGYIKLGTFFNKLQNVQIYLPDLIQWCHNTGGVDCIGIRIYFAVPSDYGFISFIIAAIGADTKEKGYYFLANEIYRQGQLSSSDNLARGRDEAIEYITRYAQQVYLTDHPFQKDNPHDKISRKYTFTEDLLKLCNDNINDVPSPYNGYYVLLTHGYVSISQSPTLCSRTTDACYDSTTKTYDGSTMVGHTSLICICSGIPPVLKIDPLAKYDHNHPKDYKGKYLEIGNPCPPDCGDIKKSDLPLP